MRYQELLDLVGKRNNVPTSVFLRDREYKICVDKNGDVIDYYCGGEALSENMSNYYLQQQTQIELTPVNRII